MQVNRAIVVTVSGLVFRICTHSVGRFTTLGVACSRNVTSPQKYVETTKWPHDSGLKVIFHVPRYIADVPKLGSNNSIVELEALTAHV